MEPGPRARRNTENNVPLLGLRTCAGIPASHPVVPGARRSRSVGARSGGDVGGLLQDFQKTLWGFEPRPPDEHHGALQFGFLQCV